MSKKNQTPPGSLVLSPSALLFSIAMLAVGAVGGYVVGKSQTPDASPAPSSVASEATTNEDRGRVVNNTDGRIRRLSDQEKKDLLAGKSPAKPDAAPDAAPADSPYLDGAILASFTDEAQRKEYEGAVGLMSKGNSRAARAPLMKLNEQDAGQTWAEPVAALLANAHASTGNLPEARQHIADFKKKWPESSHMASVVVAEGKAWMQQGKRGRAPGQKKEDPVNDKQREAYTQAIAQFDDAISKWPASPVVADAYLNMSSLQVDLGDLDAAEKTALAFADKLPSSQNAARALHNVSRAAMDSKDYGRAERALQALVQRFPKDRLARSARSQLSSLKILGKDAPPLQIEEWLGDDIGGLEAHRGKVVLLVFWATWCPHCRNEMPSLEKTWQTFSSEDFVLVAVTRNNRGQTTEKVRDYISENGLTYPVAIDPGSTSRAYGVSGIPAAALVDKNGQVVVRDHPKRITHDVIRSFL